MEDLYEFDITDLDSNSIIEVSYQPCMGFDRSDRKVLAELHRK